MTPLTNLRQRLGRWLLGADAPAATAETAHGTVSTGGTGRLPEPDDPLRPRICEPHVRPRAGASGTQTITRYPPFLQGLPAEPVQEILAAQAELIGQLRYAAGIPADSFDAMVRPVIECYAAYVHHLPASETHHHRGAGGLFRHGLEVAYHAARASHDVVFAMDRQPSERYREAPIWRAAALLGGLLHDIGKPIADVSVTDRDGDHRWDSGALPLAEWLTETGVEHYFLHWRDHRRHKGHEMMGPLVLRHVMPQSTQRWLSDADPRIFAAVLAATGGQDKQGLIGKLVMNADQISVREDLKASGYDPDAYSLGVPVDRYIVDAMRELVARGTWSCNVPGARLWLLPEGLHVVWPEGGDDIRDLLAEQDTPGVPRSAETIAEILLDRGHVQTYEAEGRTRFYRRIAPAPLVKSGKPTHLWMLRLSSPELLYRREPPLPVAQWQEHQGGASASSRQAGNSPLQAAPGPQRTAPPDDSGGPDKTGRSAPRSEPHMPPGQSAGDNDAAPGPAPTEPVAESPQDLGSSDALRPQAPEPAGLGELPDGSTFDPETGEVTQSGQPGPDTADARSGPAASKTPAPRSSSPSGAEQARAWLERYSLAGTLLLSLADAQRTGSPREPERMPYLHNDHVCVPWKSGLTGLSVADGDPKAALDLLHKAGLTRINPRTPHARTWRIDDRPVVMLTAAASARYRQMAGDMPDTCPTAGQGGDMPRSKASAASAASAVAVSAVSAVSETPADTPASPLLDRDASAPAATTRQADISRGLRSAEDMAALVRQALASGNLPSGPHPALRGWLVIEPADVDALARDNGIDRVHLIRRASRIDGIEQAGDGALAVHIAQPEN